MIYPSRDTINSIRGGATREIRCRDGRLRSNVGPGACLSAPRKIVERKRVGHGLQYAVPQIMNEFVSRLLGTSDFEKKAAPEMTFDTHAYWKAAPQIYHENFARAHICACLRESVAFKMSHFGAGQLCRLLLSNALASAPQRKADLCPSPGTCFINTGLASLRKEKVQSLNINQSFRTSALTREASQRIVCTSSRAQGRRVMPRTCKRCFAE